MSQADSSMSPTTSAPRTAPSAPPSPTWPALPDGLVYGGDYYPEQWDRKVWRADVALMRQAGVTTVNLGIFVWARIEPAPGEYAFDILDESLALLHRAGIRVNLATPTASPPAWLVHEHPDVLPVAADGRTLGLGARESFCPNSPSYRRAAVSIATALARRYGHHPALVSWHVHNEYAAHVPACYCEQSLQAFRTWLQRRYVSIEALNDAWGTVFWGQTYSAWGQIGLPGRAPMPTNPAQQLDFMRFTGEEYLACYRAERDALRAAGPPMPITTNFMLPACKHLDYWQWSGEVDFVANDHYLTATDPRPHVELAMAADLTRSVAQRRPWLLMEHSTSAVNWQPRNIAKEPGELRRNSLCHIARGADGAMFFQWRASRVGAEKFHSAMVPQAGTETRVWRDVVQLGADMAALAEVRDTVVVAAVAIVWDWASWWALELEYRPSVDLTYLRPVRECYEALWDLGVTVDFVRPDDPGLARYRAVFVPSLYLADDDATQALTQYVRDGGRLAVWYFSGIVDEYDRVPHGPYPGAFRELLGLSIEEFHPLLQHESLRARGEIVGGQAAANIWSERVTLEGAKPVAVFDDGPDAGEPAVTGHRLGRGRAWYVGTHLEPTATSSMIRTVLAEAGVPTDPDRPQGLEAVRRRSAAHSYLFLFNHETGTEITVPACGVDLLTGREHGSTVVLPPSGVAVIRETCPDADDPPL